MRAPRDEDLVWNIVWTGTVFTGLQYFAASQIAQSRSRFRFVANGCPPEQVSLMEAFASRHPDRVLEVLDVSPDSMIAHGIALDRVREIRDDGEWFALIDPDIKANAPFVPDFAALLETHDVVTSGKEVWTDDNLVPVGHKGVAGEFFYDQTGFVFGSPHLAIYRREALDDTCRRWGIGLGSAGPELRVDTSARLGEMGHDYLVYDTAKIVNALVQGDGYKLVHRDLPQLVHIGGLAHYISPPAHRTTDTGEIEPDWTAFKTMTARHEVTRYTARTLQALAAHQPTPPIPTGLEPSMEDKLLFVQVEVEDLLSRYGPQAPPMSCTDD